MNILICALLLFVIPGLIIGLFYVRTRLQPGQTFKDVLGLNPFTFLAVWFFIFSFASMLWVPNSLASWRSELLQREFWQMLGPVLLALAILKDARDSTQGRGFERRINSRTWMLAAAILISGVLPCINPTLDLLQGPMQLQGTVTPNIYQQVGGRSEYLVWGLRLQSADGSVEWLNAGDLSLRQLRAAFERYPHGRKAHLIVLRHLGAILDIEHIKWG